VGLIRKSLAVGSLGLVSGSSKKQRVARQTMRNTGATARNTKATARTGADTARHAAAIAAAADANAAADERRHQEELAYRYATDPTYRAYVEQQRAAAAELDRLERERQAAKRHMVGVRLTQAAALPVLATVLLLVTLLVWVPQHVVSRVRRTQTVPWQRQFLLTAWTGLLNLS